MDVLNKIAAFSGEMTSWRQDFHKHPELGFEEERTSAIVAQKLESWGIAVRRGIGGTGIVGTLRGRGNSTRAIGIRADMDALPIMELGDHAYRSTVPGKMHGCGHDGHTTMLLGAARYLAETRNFDGAVHFIFQPAEELATGARRMVAEGLFELFPCDMVFAVHTDPLLPLGKALAVPGPVMAAADGVSVIIKGKGGHAARPHHAIDPVLIGSHIVLALQTIPSRRVNPLEAAVVSMTQFHAGAAMNVIPDSAVLHGTIRTMKPEVQDEVERLFTEIATSTAATHGAQVEVSYRRLCPAVINDRGAAEKAARVVSRVLGEANVATDAPPSMGAEDFADMMMDRPGCYIKLGQKAEGRENFALHHPKFDFNDALLPIGASYFAALVEQELVVQ